MERVKGKKHRLVIWCDDKTFVRFRRASANFWSYEELIKTMLRVYEANPELFREPQFR